MAHNRRLSRKRLSFYLKYALRSLRRDGRRSLFAAFCMAVGVGAVVAMQSLGLVVTDTIFDDHYVCRGLHHHAAKNPPSTGMAAPCT